MGHAQLSDRQKRCLELVAQGMTSKEIAPLLDVTPGVVDNYIAAAVAKMGASGRREAARMLAEQQEGMVHPLHLQPEAIAPTRYTMDDRNQAGRIQDTRSTLKRALHHLFGLPPIGGRENDLNAIDRLSAMARIGFVAALLLIATIVIIQGVVLLLT
ncbi:MAG: helix-turn-helix transcriptional regulator [Sphingobium sp.]|nr:helix-turn-helix transcriptional regulator [Sphingobium sp.]